MSKLGVHLMLGLSAMALAGCGIFGGGGGGGDKKPKTPTLGQRIAILTAESGVEADPALADVGILLPEPIANTDWPQAGGNPNKVLEHVNLGLSVGQVWSAKISGTTKYERLASAPIVAEGKLFVVDTFARLHAFDAQSGKKIFTVQIGSQEDTRGGISLLTGEMTGDRGLLFGGGVSYDSGTLFGTNGLGDVAAFSAADGKQLWKVRPGGPLRGAPSVSDGNLYVMSQDSQLLALSAKDGSLAWSAAASTELTGIFGTASPAVAQGTVVAGFSSGELNAYRYENGRSLWGDALSRTSISTSVSSLADVDASPVIDRGRVFAIGQGGRMVSLELVTGQRLWEINVAGISTPWIAGEWLFVLDDDARLLCIARSNGKVRWISQLRRYDKPKTKKGEINWVGPVLAGGRLIVASSDGRLANVDPTTGTVQNETKAGGPVTLPLVVAGNTLYVLTDDGRLTAWR
jgi:outer membrane protein assembly factor BamB